METTKGKLSIGRAARRLRAAWAESDDWEYLSRDSKKAWCRVASTALKLFAPTAASPAPEFDAMLAALRRLLSDADAKAAAKKGGVS